MFTWLCTRENTRTTWQTAGVPNPANLLAHDHGRSVALVHERELARGRVAGTSDAKGTTQIGVLGSTNARYKKEYSPAKHILSPSPSFLFVLLA